MSWQLFWGILFFGMVASPLQGQLLPAVEGTVQDSAGNTLEAATVVLLALPDSTIQVYSLTDSKGGYVLRTKKGAYALQISYLGYQPLSIPIEVQQDTNLGTIVLQEITDTLQLIEVTAEHIPVQMRGDTLSFNSAAFRVRAHDDAGRLLRQLPGLNIQEDGTIFFNGQKVTEILVDGKVFFGEDAQATLRTLSADAIQKIDITDTQITSNGVEVAEDQKTINLRLKKEAKTGVAGNIGLGYGAVVPPSNTLPTPQNFGDHRYQADASMTYFTPNTRSAIYGRSSNVPTPNPFAISQGVTVGITRQNSAGATFNWVPSTATTWNNSYRFIQKRTTLQQTSKEISILPEQTFERLREREQVNIPLSHNFSSNLTHKLDEQHLFRIRLTGSYQENTNNSNRLENSFEKLLLQNKLQQTYQSNNQSYLLVPSVAFEKRFEKKGRQLILNLGTRWSDTPNNTNNEAWTELYDDNGNYTSTDTLLQQQERTNQQQNYSGSFLWKEPLTKKDKLYLTFKAGMEQNNTRQTAFDLEGTTRLLNTALSNSFQRFYNYQAISVSWRRKTKTYRLEVTGGMRRSFLLGISDTNTLRQELYLPTAQTQFRYNLAKGKKLVFTYNLYFAELTLNQLQPFVDNRDPLAIQLGNTDLRPTVNHRLSAHFEWFEQSNFTNIYTEITSSFVPNTILQTQQIDEDLRLTYQPVNSGLSSNLGLELGYNQLFQALDVMLDASVAGTRGQHPFLLNGTQQQQINYGYNLTFKLSNKKKKTVDWGINVNLDGGVFSYDNNQGALNEYLNQYYGGYINVEFLKYWEVQNSFGLNLYTQPLGGEDPTVALWSFRIKRHFLENEQLEIELSAENLLNESLNLQRSQQAFFLTEQRTQSLGRYVMLSFRYKFRNKN